MKRIMNLIVMLVISLLMISSYSFAQNKQQSRSSQSMDSL